MEELLVSSVCEVVDDSHLRGIELDHKLGWDRWYKTAAHGERCDIFLAQNELIEEISQSTFKEKQ